MPIKTRIRTIVDHPKPGVMFRDITTVLKDPVGLRSAVDVFVDRYRGQAIDKVVAIEARGFVLGAPLAYALGTGFVPVRKPGKLPAQTLSQSYDLEYGTDCVEMHVDAVQPKDRVLLIDDLIATGGTALAACTLLAELGAEVVECAFMVELVELGGIERLHALGMQTFCAVHYREDER